MLYSCHLQIQITSCRANYVKHHP